MMNFEQKVGRMVAGGSVEQDVPEPAVFEGCEAIRARAELRRRGQEFRVRVLNMRQPEDEAARASYDKTLALCFREAKGEEALDPSVKTPDEFHVEADRLRKASEAKRNIFPRYSAYLDLCAAKCADAAGAGTEPDIVAAGEMLDQIRDRDPHTPANLLPEAMLLGFRARQAEQLRMPDPESVARAVMSDPTLLADYALTIPEKDRAAFVDMIPEEKRIAVSRALDVSVARVLHQSIVEKECDEETQRAKVRIRLNRELRDVIGKGKKGDEPTVKLLAEALGSLGEDTRQFLLEILRDEYEGESGSGDRETEHMPRVIQTLLDRFDDWRGNDLALRVAGAEETNPHLSIHILGKLVKNGYLPSDVQTWWDEKKIRERNSEAEYQRLRVIKKTVSNLGVVPSRDILEFLSDEREWEGIPLDARIGRIRSSQEEFSKIDDNHELAHLLSEDERKAKMFYLLHGGEDRFNLINNYDFGKFKEMVGLIDGLVVHEKPLREFEQALVKGGLRGAEAKAVIRRLRVGHGPSGDVSREQGEVIFDVSENALIKNANAELGRALGREQLGVVMLFPVYREFLEEQADERSESVRQEMKAAESLSERLTLMNRIEESYPDFRSRAIATLSDDWKALGEKMILEIPLEHVFEERSVPVHGEELLPRLDARRMDLKRMKKDLLVMLKGENKEFASIQREIQKKRKARANLLAGVSLQSDERKAEALQETIRKIESELFTLETEKAMIGDRKITDRFANMSQQEKEAEMERLGNEILALTEKSPSAIFTYVLMQVLGEERLCESDRALVEEMKSHLEGPFQAIADATTYRKPLAEQGGKKRARVRLQLLDKTERFMTMARFGDSKICCFSSSNYEMTVQHQMPNKFWVASISADPLSYVISIENPSADASDGSGRKTPKENLGFIFGSFGVDERGFPARLDNGIYYAPGLEGKEQMEAILSGVEKLFDMLPIRTEVIAGRHGGSFGEDVIPGGYSKEEVMLTRLRALDDGRGNPETKIYDDLATGSDLNGLHRYGGNNDVIWHKTNGN
ncbi:MAG TPA: hypothetical protein VN420_01280 [Candidatus Fimivivens sp.]|nr:hypothetical protein [Candidatus Fimivivens sp.]